MTRALRHAAALTDHREFERLDHSLLQSVAELAGGSASRSPHAEATIPLNVRLWRVLNPTAPTPVLELVARLDADCVAAADLLAHHCLQENRVVQGMRPRPDGHLLCMTWLPVQRRSHTLGVLEIESPTPLTPSRLTLVQGMCSLYANHLSLLHESQVDTLTQLLNRKTFDDSIQRLLNAPSPGAQQTWVAVIDIDHFKRINDGYGHLFGDEVLLLVAGMLRGAFRQQDKVFRFGGEEFVVLLRELEEAGAVSALERLRQTIENHRFPQVGQVTVSIGATGIRAGDAACDALGRADDALYHAKSQGRNRLYLFEHLQAHGSIAPAAALHGDVDLF